MNNQSEPIQFFCDINIGTSGLNGQIITRSDKLPNYGWIHLYQQILLYKNERMVVSEKVCKVAGYIGDLLELKWDNNTRLNKNKHQIVHEESIFLGKEDEIIKNLSLNESLKRAWENGPLLKYQNCLIIIKSYLTTDMSIKSNYIEHDNWDEIQEYIFKYKSGKVFSEINKLKDGIHGEIVFYQETMRFDTLLKKYVEAYKSFKIKDTMEKLETLNLVDIFNIIEEEYVLGDAVKSQSLESNFNLHFFVCPKNRGLWQGKNNGIVYTLNNKLIYKDSFLTTDQRQRDVVVHKKELNISVDTVIGLDHTTFSFRSYKAYLCVRKTINDDGFCYVFFSPVYYKTFYNRWFDHNYMYGFRTTDEVAKKINIGAWYDIARDLFNKFDEINEPMIHLHRNGGYKIGIVMDYFLKSDEKIKRITDEHSFRKLFTQRSMLELINEAEIDQYYQDEYEQNKKDT